MKRPPTDAQLRRKRDQLVKTIERHEREQTTAYDRRALDIALGIEREALAAIDLYFHRRQRGFEPARARYMAREEGTAV